MEQCTYIMCDGYQCQALATTEVDGESVCDDHAEALRNGIDPMDDDMW